MNGLRFFTRTSQQRCWNVASYHSPHSLTWSWVVSLSLFRGDEARVWPLWFSYRTNDGLQWGFRIPWLGIVQWHRQRPVYYRDLYHRQRDEQDREKYQAHLKGAAARETIREARERSSVIDTSRGVH